MNAQRPFTICPVSGASDLADIRSLFRAYAASLDVDLAYQNFEAELAALPGAYASPQGTLLLARMLDGTAVGCVGLRAMTAEGCCEMKRLYIDPSARGLHLGESLVNALVGEASRIGYHTMKLDTLPTMGVAMALYRKLGFREIAPYYDTPIAGTRFMSLDLRDNAC